MGLDDLSECKKRGLRILRTNPLYPTILAREVENYFMRGNKSYRTEGLTPRQWEYVKMFRETRDINAVAAKMCTTRTAVVTMQKTICRSLGVKDLDDALLAIEAIEKKREQEKARE